MKKTILKNISKNISCVAQSSLSSIDDILVTTPPPTPTVPPPPPKPSARKNPDIIIIGPKPVMMQRTPPTKGTPQQQNDVAGAAPAAEATATTAPPPTSAQPPTASQQTEPPTQIPASQGSAPYIHPNGRARNTPPTGSGGPPANATAVGGATGTRTRSRTRNTPRDEGIDTINVGVAVDEDEIPEEDLQVNEEIERTVNETPEQVSRWRQKLALTIKPRMKYKNDLKLVLRALRHNNDWQQVAALLDQMENSFEDWETKRVVAMSERDGKLLDSDDLLAKMQCEFVKVKKEAKVFIQQRQYQQQMQQSAAAAEQNIANMESLADDAAQRLQVEQQRVANVRAQEDRAAEEERAAAAAQFAASAGGMANPPPFTEAGTGVAPPPPFTEAGRGAGAPPPVNNDRTHAAAGQDDIELIEQDRALSAMSLHSTHRSTPTTEMSWDLNNGGQIFWDPTSNSNAQYIDPRLTNSARRPPKKARLGQQHSRPVSRGTMIPPGAGGGAIPATNNQGFIPPTQVTYMHQHQQPVYQQQHMGPQQHQQGLHAGLTVTRPEDQAGQLTTSLQPPQQQLPQQQHVFNTQANYHQLAQPVAQHGYMPPPGMTTTTLPPPAMHAPHPPPLQAFQTVQQQQGVNAANGQFMQAPINAQQQHLQYPPQLQALWQQQQQNQLQLHLQTAQVLKEIADGNRQTQQNSNSDLKTIAESIHARKLNIKDHVPMLKIDPGKPLSAADFAHWLRKMDAYEKKFLDYNTTNSTKYEQLYSELITRVDGSANLLIFNQNPDESTYKDSIQLLKDTFYSKRDLQQQTIDRLRYFKKIIDSDESLLDGHSTLSDIFRTMDELNLREKDLNYLFIMGFILPKLSEKMQQRYFQWVEVQKKIPGNEKYPLGWDADPKELLPLMRDHRGAIRDQTALRPNRPQQGGGPAGQQQQQQQQGRNNQGRNNGNNGQNRSNATQSANNNENCGFCKALGKTASHKKVRNCDSIEKLFKKNGGINGSGSEAIHKICVQEGYSCRLCLAKGHKAKNCDKADSIPKCTQVMKTGKRKGEACGSNHNKFLHWETAQSQPKSGGAGATGQQQTKSGSGSKNSKNTQGGGYRRSNATKTGGSGAAGGQGGQGGQGGKNAPPQNNQNAPPQNLQGAMVPYQNFVAVPQPQPVPMWYSQGPMPQQRQMPDSTTGAIPRNHHNQQQ